MVAFEPELFFPYEVILLFAALALFVTIYRYLSNSLETKKEILANSIMNNYMKEMQLYEARLSKYLRIPELPKYNAYRWKKWNT
jgi:hypothetical protein